MIRFVVGPGGDVVPDVKRKLPGRGIWITAHARRARGGGQAQRVCPRLQARRAGRRRSGGDRPSGCWSARALDALAIAGKAGSVVGGFAKVEAAIGRDDVLALIHAADAAADGKRKLDAALQRETAGKSREIAVIDGIYRRPIGFGIEPPKCGTCSPACRPRERYFSRSRCALEALSDRKFARCG